MSRLSIILFAMFILFLIPIAAGSAMDSVYLFNFSINSNENVAFANHNESEIDGNWIKLSGGKPVILPTLKFIYYGPHSTTYTCNKNGNIITITSNVDSYKDYQIEYPNPSYSIYTNESGSNEVNLSFLGSSHFANLSIDVYLASSIHEEVWDFINDLADGDTTSFRDLLNNSEKRLNYSLNSTGDNSSISFGSQQAGDYVIFVLLNSSHITNPNNFSVLSGTIVQVLEYESVVTVPSMVKTNYILPVKMELSTVDLGNYTYGAILVHKNAYDATLRFDFNGTRNQTNIIIDGTDFIDKSVLTGINFSSLSTTKFGDSIETVIGPNNGTVSIINNVNSTSASFSLTTNDLNTGDYYLFVGAYKSGKRLVAFKQSEINIYTLTPPPSDDGGSSVIGVSPSNEDYENIVCTGTNCQYVGKDLNVKYNFTLDCNCVKHIEFTGLTNTGIVVAKIDILDHTSPLVDKDAPNIVFKNLNVWVGNIDYFSEINIKDPTITFMVDKSWVNDNNIILNTISLYSYNKATKAWEKMSTEKISEDSLFYIFKASLPIRGNLGPMAISGKESLIIPSHVLPTSTPSQDEHVTIWPKIVWFQVLILTIFIALILLFIIKRRKKKQDEMAEPISS